jgi:hypothetical protein
LHAKFTFYLFVMFSHDEMAYISPWRKPKAVCRFPDFIFKYRMIIGKKLHGCMKCRFCGFYRLLQGA